MKPVAIPESPIGLVLPAEQAPSDSSKEAEVFEALVSDAYTEDTGVESADDDTASVENADSDAGVPHFASVLIYMQPQLAAPSTSAQRNDISSMTEARSIVSVEAPPQLKNVTVPLEAEGVSQATPVTGSSEEMDAVGAIATPIASAAGVAKNDSVTNGEMAQPAFSVTAREMTTAAEGEREVEFRDLRAAEADGAERTSTPDIDSGGSDTGADSDLGADAEVLADGAKAKEESWRGGVFALYEATQASNARHGAPAVATDQGALARQVSQQVNQSVAGKPDGTVELALSPDELGHVKVVLKHEDGGMFVTIQAERQETLDLMRRHIDVLARDFRDLGYADVSFSFNDNNGGQRLTPESLDLHEIAAGPEDPALLETLSSATAPRPMAASAGLDLRM